MLGNACDSLKGNFYSGVLLGVMDVVLAVLEELVYIKLPLAAKYETNSKENVFYCGKYGHKVRDYFQDWHSTCLQSMQGLNSVLATATALKLQSKKIATK